MYGYCDSAVIYGVEAVRILVEADYGDGLPAFEMVGFLGAEVREAKERVKSALKNAGFLIPPGRLTVSLSPANLRKSGNSFDLPIAIAILVAAGILPEELVKDYAFSGELALDGHIRAVHGLLSHVLIARENAKKGCVVPLENAAECAVFPDFPIYAFDSLCDLIRFLREPDENARAKISCFTEAETEQQLDFSEIIGQESVKRAAVIACAGMHGLLMIGPPGTGKTLTARRIPSILPPLTEEERIECTKIHSVAGILNGRTGLIRNRPFRSPHHTISVSGLIGGGAVPRPGEMSLSHNGVLFLDELPEFNKMTLEVMRQPLEDRQVVISRAQGSFVFPTRVMLVAAMNPCRCGYYPDRNLCRCSEMEVRRYLSCISKPLLDRIDITVEVGRLKREDLEKGASGTDSSAMREQVVKAHEIQKKRYENDRILFNSQLSGGLIRKYCALSPEEEKLLSDAFDRLKLSVRARDRILKLARTIADVEGEARITKAHLSEAITYRLTDRQFFNGR